MSLPEHYLLTSRCTNQYHPPHQIIPHTLYMTSYFPMTIRDWNHLPIPIIESVYKFEHINSVLEIIDGHWPFSDQFQHLADQNPCWSAYIFNGTAVNSLQNIVSPKNGQPISDPYFFSTVN